MAKEKPGRGICQMTRLEPCKFLTTKLRTLAMWSPQYNFLILVLLALEKLLRCSISNMWHLSFFTARQQNDELNELYFNSQCYPLKQDGFVR